MYINERNSAVINIVKGYLTVLVVALHTSFDAGLRYQDGIEPFLRVLISIVGGVAVPVFFFISGLLFFTRMQDFDWSVWKEKVRRRFKSLFVPYVMWIIAALILWFVWGIMKKEVAWDGIVSFKDFFVEKGGLRIFYDRPQHIYETSMLGYFVDSSQPIDGPLWYVRDLMVLVLFSPIIWKVLRATKNYALVIFAAIYLLFIGLPFVLISPVALFFFSAGAAVSISGVDFLERLKTVKIPSYILSLVFLFLSFVIEDPLWNGLVSRCFVLSSVGMIFNLTAHFYDAGKIKPVKLLSDSSFFIYASHAVLITEISNFILWRAFPITAEWMLVLKVFLRPAVAIGICLLLFVTMKKICPKFLGLLTGGRC